MNDTARIEDEDVKGLENRVDGPASPNSQAVPQLLAALQQIATVCADNRGVGIKGRAMALSFVHQVANDALAASHSPAKGQEGWKEALAREEKYLHECMDNPDTDIMHGDLEGAFHRLGAALLVSPAPPSSGEEEMGQPASLIGTESLSATTGDHRPEDDAS